MGLWISSDPRHASCFCHASALHPLSRSSSEVGPDRGASAELQRLHVCVFNFCHSPSNLSAARGFGLNRVWYLHYTEGLVIISELNVIPVCVCVCWHFRCWMCTNEPWLHLTVLHSLFCWRTVYSTVIQISMQGAGQICLLEMLFHPDLLCLSVTCWSCGCPAVIQSSRLSMRSAGWFLKITDHKWRAEIWFASVRVDYVFTIAARLYFPNGF